MGIGDIRVVGIVGCGTMGSGISEVCARAGYEVRVHEVDDQAVERGLERIRSSMERAVTGGKLGSDDRDAALGRITAHTELEGLKDADIVVECVPEQLDLKRDVFARLDALLPEQALLTTNTSSLPVIELAVATNRPQRVVGLHFFNPAPVMQLVELVHTVTTDDAALQQARGFAEALGKTAIACRDRAGFIANLLLFPYLNEAVRMLESGFASREDIDAAMRFGAGHPMGPLALMDLVGLDSCYLILESLHRQFSDRRYAPAPMIKHLVSAGYRGRKSGHGFYTYAEPGSPDVLQDERGGRSVTLPNPTGEIRTVAVLGTGTMGSGVVEVAAKAGYDVVCRGRSEDSLAKAQAAMERSLGRAVDRGRMSPEDRDAALGRVTWTTEIQALADADLVVETLAEDLELKKQVFAELDAVAKPDAILSTCTSSLPVVELASVTSRPDRVCGVHFFNPAPIMRLVELVSTVATSPEVIATSKAAVERMRKHAVLCEDRAGFIVNRLLFPYINDAVKMLESGYATETDIDTAMTLGCAHPMGPLALADIVGLDVTLEILNSLHAEFREPSYAPAPLLEHMVKAGYLGRKTKRGFHTY
ncbi:MAG TPA: 3-hydroxybutyryl-CoA dehydrogenase [Actinomycetota bacterium]|nr:3-hydroxybutyryl-CoA dehydrogenase [Actinomycetota bacterium]